MVISRKFNLVRDLVRGEPQGQSISSTPSQSNFNAIIKSFDFTIYNNLTSQHNFAADIFHKATMNKPKAVGKVHTLRVLAR